MPIHEALPKEGREMNMNIGLVEPMEDLDMHDIEIDDLIVTPGEVISIEPGFLRG